MSNNQRSIMSSIVTAVALMLSALPVRYYSAAAFSPHASFELNEELPAGSSVGSIRDALRSSLQADELANISVRLFLPEDPAARLFQLSTNGSIFTSQRIDRDRLCESRKLCCDGDMRQPSSSSASPHCRLKFDARVTTFVNRRFLIPTIEVKLIDLNDNEPVFRRSKYTVRFKETDRTGQLEPLPMADDADWGRNGIEAYNLVSIDQDSVGDSMFELRAIRDTAAEPSSSTLYWKSLELLNRMPIDRERRAWYGFNLTARDGGGKIGQTFLNVTIDDVNDCSPEFLNVTNGVNIRVDVPEDTRPHSVIFNLLAVDRDEGQNGRIVYSLRPGRRHREASALFGVDSYTGRVVLNSQLNYRRGESNLYEIYVIAQDSGIPRRSSEIAVEINVLDVNNHRPSIRVQGLDSAGGSSSSVRVKENFEYTRQEVVATLQASDLDDGDNGRVTCELASGRDKFGLKIFKGPDAGTAIVYSLYTYGTFDRESQPVHSLSVECRDHGDNPMRSEAVIRVEVEDVNDSPPVWRQPEYAFSIRENQPPGSHVGRVSADDADASPNDIIRYSILTEYETESARRVISVNEFTGQLLTEVSLDREERDRYNFKVVATNTEAPNFLATVGVTLMILDLNDNSPAFADNTPSQVLVMEDAPLMTLVALINVTDADEPGNRKFRFSVSSEDGRPASKFRISDLGELVLIGGLDREVDPEHRLKVSVTDNGLPPRSSVFSLTVLVGDVNDTPPTFIFPDGQRQFSQVNISNSLPMDSLIAKIQARDEDEGLNGKLSYQLLHSDTSTAESDELKRYFQLDPVSGFLRLRASLTSLSTPRVFTLRIRASDSGRERQKTRDALLKILVTPDAGSGDPGSGEGGRHQSGVGSHPRRTNSDGQHPMLLLVLLAAGLAIVLVLVLFLLAVYSVSARRRAGLTAAGTGAGGTAVSSAGAGGAAVQLLAPKLGQPLYDSLVAKTTNSLANSSPGQSIPLALTKNRRKKTIDMFELDSTERVLGDREYGRQSAMAFNARPMAYHSESDLTGTINSPRGCIDGQGCADDYSGAPHQQPQHHYTTGPVSYTPLCGAVAQPVASVAKLDSNHRHYVVSSSTIAVVSPPANKRLRAPYDNISDV